MPPPMIRIFIFVILFSVAGSSGRQSLKLFQRFNQQKHNFFHKPLWVQNVRIILQLILQTQFMDSNILLRFRKGQYSKNDLYLYF